MRCLTHEERKRMADNLSRRQALGLGAAVAGAAVAAPIIVNEAFAGTNEPAAAVGPGTKVPVTDLPWPAAQKIVTDTEAQIKPQTKQFNVMSFGAKADGKTDNTA